MGINVTVISGEIFHRGAIASVIPEAAFPTESKKKGGVNPSLSGSSGRCLKIRDRGEMVSRILLMASLECFKYCSSFN